MKKYLFVLLFVSSAVCASAQIQRKFFDFNLGTTTRQEVVSYFSTRKKTVEKDYENNRISVRKVKFAGHTWACVFFHFYNKKLYRIRFTESDAFIPTKSLDDLQNTIVYSLLSKYNRYIDEEKRLNNDNKFFHDDRTMIKLVSEYYNDTKILGLTYTDTFLFFEKSEKDDDEL